jgi:predicted ATPase
MLDAVRLKHFKAFRDTGSIRLKPLTILAGPNSSGKSSIMQSLLLLKQTLESETPNVDLDLSGRFLQFSNFSEVSFRRPPVRSAHIQYMLTIHTPIPNRVVQRYFPDGAIPEGDGHSQLHTDVQITFRQRHSGHTTPRIVTDELVVRSTFRGTSGPSLAVHFRDGQYQARMEGSGVDLPKAYRGRRVHSAIGKSFIPTLLALEPIGQDSKERQAIVTLDPIFNNPLMQLSRELSTNLKYLGPLRHEPQRAYLHSGSSSPEIGQRGEYAAQLLWLNRNSEIDYAPVPREGRKRVPLLEAVNNSFQQLGIAETISVKSIGSVMYQLLLESHEQLGRPSVSIADVGFGVSQILPVVVLCLLTEDSSTILLEQPEIHMHPRIQANLADFLISVARSGRRIIVETHSDHLIHRLRRRIVEDDTNELRSDVSILFVRSGSGTDGSSIEPLTVDQYGVIENWPPDFLPEAAGESEAIFRAAIRKRQR